MLGLAAAAACSSPGASAVPGTAFHAFVRGMSTGNVPARSRSARCGAIRSTGIRAGARLTMAADDFDMGAFFNEVPVKGRRVRPERAPRNCVTCREH